MTSPLDGRDRDPDPGTDGPDRPASDIAERVTPAGVSHAPANEVAPAAGLPTPETATPVTAAGSGSAGADAPPGDVPDDHDPAIRSGKLAGKSIPLAITILALPVLLEQFANACVGLVDQMLAGALPADIVRPALDGVATAAFIGWFINICISAIGIGGSALIARAIGGGKHDLAHDTLGQAVTLSLVWGVVVGVALWLLAPALAAFLRFSPEAAGYFTEYVRILSYGLPVTSLMFVSMNCLHGAGETTRPFLIMLVVNAVNIVSSWWLSGVPVTIGGATLVSPLGADLHVTGIALGTVIGRCVGALLMVAVMVVGIRDLRLEWSRLKPSKEIFWRVTRIGVPGFAEGIGLWFGTLCVLVVIGWIAAGESGMLGSHSMAIRWESFAFLPAFALGTAASALGGQFLGAGNSRRAARAIWTCAILGGTFMGLCGLAFIFAGETLTRIISDDPYHLELVPKLLFWGGIAQVPFGFSMVLRVALRGVGDVRWVMVISWVTTWGVRLPLAWLVGYKLGFGIIGVWVVLSSELYLRALFFIGRTAHGGWKHVRV